MTVLLGLPRRRISTSDAADLTADLAGRPAHAGLVDRFGRVATDLRVSLTDRCNLRCTYCMPEGGIDPMPSGDVLTDAEVVRLVGIAVTRLGVSAVRFTGGEPLLRAGLADIVAGAAGLRGPGGARADLALTTNAIGLAERAATLAAAGLHRVNVSLDSLDPEVYAEVTRRPLLQRALDGIHAARDAGLAVKVNAVLVPGVNEHEAAGLVAWALDAGVELRFIEQMPLGGDRTWTRDQVVTAARTRALIGERFDLEPHPAPREGAPAERIDVHERGGHRSGTIGIIASVTEPFCGDCRRTRLTADGAIRDCLFAHDETPLRDLMRAGATDDELADRWRAAMWRKRAGHGIDDPGFAQPARPMSAIGG